MVAKEDSSRMILFSIWSFSASLYERGLVFIIIEKSITISQILQLPQSVHWRARYLGSYLHLEFLLNKQTNNNNSQNYITCPLVVYHSICSSKDASSWLCHLHFLVLSFLFDSSYQCHPQPHPSPSTPLSWGGGSRSSKVKPSHLFQDCASGQALQNPDFAHCKHFSKS